MITSKAQQKADQIQIVLTEIDTVVPWQPLVKLIELYYLKTGFKGGRPSFPLKTMLRIHLLQHCPPLSDPSMEDALIEVPTMRRFAGIDMISERIPDETLILAFRHLLEKHNLGKEIHCFAEDCVYETVKAHLKARGMAMKRGAIIDATLIAAPSSTKNKQGERDLEMHQTRKGRQ